ncbi:MAG TPA: UDP-3-O-(3-hydroxymyristoyl)glucosamine N-acyltransferase [Saprospiraceae bacterium]|nr:UDP-3-O-(3-hydroxymyristoyl)glucosamine N-acyltransferase [Saprospiraceae bacterium]
MIWTAKQLAELLQGELIGNPETKLSHPSKIEEATEGSVCFLGNMKYEHYLYETKAALVLIPKDFQPKQNVNSCLLKVDSVYESVAKLLEIYNNKTKAAKSIHPSAIIDSSSVLGSENSIGPYVVVESSCTIGSNNIIHAQVYIGENASIGDHCVIHPGVKIYANTIIGSHCIIHSNTVIGSDGFGYVPNQNKEYQKIAQIGNVIIEDHVEIGANCSIDRATMGSTIIERGCKIDNLIQIAHNVTIGHDTVIAAQAGIAGSSKIGSNSIIGGQVGIAGHLNVAKGTMIQAQSGIASNLLIENGKWYGSPAIDYFSYLRAYSEFTKLPNLRKRLEDLEKKQAKE